MKGRALVTGAGGFIGSHFMHYLAGRGWAVRAIDVHEPPGTVNGNIEFRIQDIRDEIGMRNALEGVDYVFNLASVHLDVAAIERGYRRPYGAGFTVELGVPDDEWVEELT